jgi:hypothetical protein
MFLIDCKQDGESENVVNRLSFEVSMYSNANSKIVDSLGRRAEKMSFLITAAAPTLFWSFEPCV